MKKIKHAALTKRDKTSAWANVMPPEPRILLIGHSHVKCVEMAARRQGQPSWLRIVNLLRLNKQDRTARSVLELTKGFEPDAVCLCLGGNFHNVIGMLEHPQPFSIWPGCVEGRSLIPRSLMRDLFEEHLHPQLMADLFEPFSVQRLVMDVPPPVFDFEHIRAHPGRFADRLRQGLPPAELRRQLYKLQSNVLRDLAVTNQATFVLPPAAVADRDGFLAQPYRFTDPTHGNAEYGRVMLEEILTSLRVAA